MGSEELVRLNIHYGGSMKKFEGGFKYEGELGFKSVVWKERDIQWGNFYYFLVNENVSKQLKLIWFKESTEEMKDINYMFDCFVMPVRVEICFGVKAKEFDVFLEHEYSLDKVTSRTEDVIYLPSSQSVGNGNVDRDEVVAREEVWDREGTDGDDERDNNRENDEEDGSDDEGVDRPKEDEEPEESEDERHVEQETEIGMQEEEGIEEDLPPGSVDPNEPDDGDDVVRDAGDGAEDERFKTVFEEGERSHVNEEIAYSKDSDEEEESDPEFGFGDVMYPDTPLETGEEWEQWDNVKGSRSKRKHQFHGDYTREPYIWLFQKFNSGLEFKDQLLRYSLNTQFDIKMAKSEANRIAVVCCKEKCAWRVFCSVEKPINKWMVKVCNMAHNHGENSRVSMLKQSVIAGLFREELRRNPCMQGNEIKDAIKARYNIIVPISKCYRGRRIALDAIMEAQTIQFGKLWDYESELRRSNPGVTTELKTEELNGVQIFDCFYICFEPLRRAWKSNCRHVIGLDGCFLKWELKGDLLAVVGRDADNKMFPIAWAVVDIRVFGLFKQIPKLVDYSGYNQM